MKVVNKLCKFTFLFFFVSLLNSPQLLAQTFTLDTQISTLTTPNASISSILDSNHTTHLAWVADTEDGEQVMYGQYTSAGVFTSTTVSQEFYRVGAVAIVSDDLGNPHITYFIKRDSNPEYTFTRSGNYAVYYAGSANGGLSFITEQVSTNVADRTNDSSGIYHSYVNGRPQIAINASAAIVVLYTSESDDFGIMATRTGASSWTRTQAFNIDDLPGNVRNGFEMLPRPTANNYLAWYNTNDPQFISNNVNTTVTGYSGSSDNKHMQLELDGNGNVHYFWFRNDSDVRAFYHTILNGNSYGTVTQIDIATKTSGSLKSVTGNLKPATLDSVTGKYYLLYLEGSFGVSGTFLIEYDPVTQSAQEFELTDVGVPFGKRSLNVHNGLISFVGGASGRLYITHQDAATLGFVNTAPTISGSPDTSVTSGQSYSFTPTADDFDNDNLTFSITNKPAWASFSTSTGVLTGTPQSSDEGSYSNVTISVSDGTDTTSLSSFSISVNPVFVNSAPAISGTPSSSVTVGNVYSFTPVSSDADGDDLTFSISNKPVWTSFNTVSGVLSGTPQSSDIATYNGIVITVTDGTDSSALSGFSITVNAIVIGNTVPTISGTPASDVIADNFYSFTPVAQDSDGDGLLFSIINQPAWSRFSTLTGKLSGTPQSSDEGLYSAIIISVSDGSATASLNAFVIEVISSDSNIDLAPLISGAPDGQVDVDELYSFSPSFSDADSINLIFSIINQPSWSTFSTSTGSLTGRPTSGDEATYNNIVISVSDGSNTASLLGFSITVNELASPTPNDDETNSSDDSGGGGLTLSILLMSLLARRQKR